MKYRSEQGAVFNLGFDHQMCQLPAESECGFGQLRRDKKSGDLNVGKYQKRMTAELSSTVLSSTELSSTEFASTEFASAELTSAALFTPGMCAEVQGYYRLNLMRQGVVALLAGLEERL